MDDKAKPTSWPRARHAGAVFGSIALLLASLAACSQATTSTPQTQSRDAKSDLLTSNPYAGKTPAQRRAAWLKRKPAQQPAAALAQNEDTRRPVGGD